MNDNSKNIDKLFKDSLFGMNVEPSPTVWRNIFAALGNPSYGVPFFGILSRNALLITASVATVIIATVLLLDKQTPNQEIAEVTPNQNIQTATNIAQDNAQKNTINYNDIIETKETNNDNEIIENNNQTTEKDNILTETNNDNKINAIENKSNLEGDNESGAKNDDKQLNTKISNSKLIDENVNNDSENVDKELQDDYKKEIAENKSSSNTISSNLNTDSFDKGNKENKLIFDKTSNTKNILNDDFLKIERKKLILNDLNDFEELKAIDFSSSNLMLLESIRSQSSIEKKSPNRNRIIKRRNFQYEKLSTMKLFKRMIELGQISAFVNYQPEYIFNQGITRSFEQSVNLEMNLAYKHISFHGGVGFSQTSENFSQTLSYFTNDSVGYYKKITSFDWDPVQDTITYYYTNITLFDTVQHDENQNTHSQYGFIRLPVLIGFNILTKNRFNFKIKTGPVINFKLSESNSRTTSPIDAWGLQLVNTGGNQKLDFNWYLHAGVQMEYLLSSDMSFSLEPTYHFYLSPTHKNTTYSKNPYSFGLRIGIMYYFKQ